MQAIPWTCPHCNRPTTIGPDLHHVQCNRLDVGESRHGHLGITLNAIRCPNPHCNDVTVVVTVGNIEYVSTHDRFIIADDNRLIDAKRFRPEYFFSPQPEFIPEQLRNDYYEACRIRDLSPKAAATLARRCLQGIIRDFWQVTDRNLQKEIAVLRGQIDQSLWDAIDAVRRVGNIGAHMEGDVNKIVAIDPDEADKLIGLVEILFQDCYVARYERQKRLAEMAALGQQKDNERKQ